MKEIVRDTEKNRLLISDRDEGSRLVQKTDFREKMLINNHIEGILELTVNVTDNRKSYEYDTTGLNTLESFITKRSLGALSLKEILKELCGTVINGDRFMLEDDDFVIGPEYIFLDKDNHPFMAYFPGYDRPFREQMGNLAEYLMNRIDYRDKEAVLLTYTVYMKCREEGFYIGDLYEYLKKENVTGGDVQKQPDMPLMDYPFEKIDEQPPKLLEADIYDIEPVKDTVVKGPAAKEMIPGNKKYIIYIAAAFIPVILMAVLYKAGLLTAKNGRIDPAKMAAVAVLGIGVAVYMVKKIIPVSLKVKDKKITDNKDVNSNDDEATELLFDRNGADSKQEHYYLESDRYPDIEIDHFPFTIGKDKVNTDFCLNFPGVSRLHARLDRTNSGIYISDKNSTNGVYVNGKRAETGIPCPLSPGDTVELGVCSYTLKKNSNG